VNTASIVLTVAWKLFIMLFEWQYFSAAEIWCAYCSTNCECEITVVQKKIKWLL